MIVSTAVTAAALYATTFVLVRLAGRRTVSQLSAFDALVTIVLGSIVAGAIISTPPSYSRGATAVVTLLALQLAVGAVRQRSPRLRRVLDFSGETVHDDGRTQLDRNPFGAQLTPDQIDSALRQHGIRSLDTVATIVLEPDGRLSVLRHGPADSSP